MFNSVINYFKIKFHNHEHVISSKTALKILVNLMRCNSSRSYPQFLNESPNYQLLRVVGAVKSKPNCFSNVDTKNVDYLTKYGRKLALPVVRADNKVFAWLGAFIVLSIIVFYILSDPILVSMPLTMDRLLSLITYYIFYIVILIAWLITIFKAIHKAIKADNVFHKEFAKLTNKLNTFS